MGRNETYRTTIPDLERIVASASAQRSRGSVLAYAGLAAVLGLTTSAGHAHPVWAALAFIGALVLGLVRLRLARAFDAMYARGGLTWTYAFRAGTILAGVYWAIGTTFVVQTGTMWDRLTSLIATAGIAAGAAMSLSLDRALLAVYLACVLFPVVVRCMLMGGQEALGTSISVVLYYGFLIHQARENRHHLLDSHANAALLEARAEALDLARKKAEDAEAVADRANRAKGHFLANMSHEVRTPMSAIMGYTELLMDDDLSAEERRPCLEAIQQSSKHLLHLLTDVLDLAKLESGKMSVQLQQCDLFELVQELDSAMRLTAAHRGLDFKLVVNPRVPRHVASDALRLKQILLNLVGNAVKFTESGSVTVRVHIEETGTHEQTLCFDVADTGIGISPENSRLLFQPFSQVDPSATRRASGTGLGLVISREFARLLGGDIRLRSEPGKGSVFVLAIPVVAALEGKGGAQQLQA